jgi:ectoine hydroxylase
MQLTQDQIAHFHEQGWLFLPELFTPEEVTLLRREDDALLQEARRVPAAA